jgi:hypothetical protein
MDAAFSRFHSEDAMQSAGSNSGINIHTTEIFASLSLPLPLVGTIRCVILWLMALRHKTRKRVLPGVSDAPCA